MRQLLINKWLKELEIEIQKSIEEVNYAKLVDLQKLKHQLVRLRDGTN